MVLQYLNIPADYSALVNRLRTLRVAGVGSPFHNLRHLETLGVKVLIKRGEISTLYSSLEEGLPPIALVDTAQLPYWTERTSHAVVVVGIEGDLIRFASTIRLSPMRPRLS